VVLSIPRETIDIIRDRAQIEEIVRKYVPTLQKKGRNYLGLCPFHKEKTPSFTVSPEKQIFYCFGCHAGGNVFSFISKIEKLNFPESVSFLGEMLGIKVKEEYDRARDPAYESILRINRTAMEIYREALRSAAGAPAREYLRRRGVSDESIAAFALGFAPDGWNYLTDRLAQRRIPLELAMRAGLVSISEKTGRASHYDRFRNRVIFPIAGRKNEILAFGGRIIDAGEPKYLNSPETEVFKKGNVLYGLNIAGEHVSALKRAIVVEGYLDVIGCHQAGVKNAVAPLGTALTSSQLRLLSRLCSEIILVFDADSAGIKASLRSLELAGEINAELRVAVLPEADPFEFISNRGVREFMAVVDTARGPVDFRLERVMAEASGRGRLDTLMAMFEVIRGVEYETERSRYLKKISSMLGAGESEVRGDFRRFLDGRPVNRREGATAQAAARERLDFLARSFRDLIALLCYYPELVEQAVIDFSEADIADPTARSLFSRLAEMHSAGETISLDRLYDYFPDGVEKEFLDTNLFREYRIESPAAAYSEIYLNIKRYLIDQKIQQYVDHIKKAKSPGSADMKLNVTELEVELEILSREREKLSAYIYNKRIP